MIEIKLPIILIGDGNLIKYKTIKDAELDLEAYDIHEYYIFDMNCREISLYKKDKYFRVGFHIINEDKKCEKLKNMIKEYANDYDLTTYTSNNLSDLIKEIPCYKY